MRGKWFKFQTKFSFFLIRNMFTLDCYAKIKVCLSCQTSISNKLKGTLWPLRTLSPMHWRKKKIGDEVRMFNVPVNLSEIAARITIKPLVERQFREDSQLIKFGICQSIIQKLLHKSELLKVTEYKLFDSYLKILFSEQQSAEVT